MPSVAPRPPLIRPLSSEASEPASTSSATSPFLEGRLACFLRSGRSRTSELSGKGRTCNRAGRQARYPALPTRPWQGTSDQVLVLVRKRFLTLFLPDLF